MYPCLTGLSKLSVTVAGVLATTESVAGLEPSSCACAHAGGEDKTRHMVAGSSAVRTGMAAGRERNRRFTYQYVGSGLREVPRNSSCTPRNFPSMRSDYCCDIGEQFLPIQRNLAASDLLNQWTTPIGSAVFAVPPGCAPGGWIGEPLLG